MRMAQRQLQFRFVMSVRPRAREAAVTRRGHVMTGGNPAVTVVPYDNAPNEDNGEDLVQTISLLCRNHSLVFYTYSPKSKRFQTVFDTWRKWY